MFFYFQRFARSVKFLDNIKNKIKYSDLYITKLFALRAKRWK